MQEFVEDEGIKHQVSAPYTPQMNGVMERKNRTLIGNGKEDEFKSPHNFWGEAIATAVHASNRLFLRPIYNKTPYELLTGNKPNVSYFRVFGCKCFVKNKKEKLGKFISRTIEGIFVGYADESHAYRYYNKSTRRVEVSCDVDFDENNGSQEEQVLPGDVGDEESSQVIRTMGIGHILPCETHHHEDQANNGEDSSSTQVEPSSTQVEPSSTQVEPMSTQEEPITQEEMHTQEQTSSPQANEQDQDGEQNVTTSQDQAQEDDHDQRSSQVEFIDHEGIVCQVKATTKSSDIMVDRILGNISKGVLTR
jgi:hypothetical protein